jgi:uncharacterized ion transporter superfamily protein YfcC
MRKIPHTYVLLFAVICLAALATWVLPGGQFERAATEVNGSVRQLIVAESFQTVASKPQSWQIFTAFFKGFERQAGIIVFIFIVGGVFYQLQQSRALDLGILSLVQQIRRLEKAAWAARLGGGNLVIVLCMALFAVFGAVFGMSEETIPFVLLFVPLARSLGYDAIVGVAMCFVGAALGFAGALLNPFTIGVAQGIAGVQPFSGLEYRLFCFAIINLVGISYVLWYARSKGRYAAKSLCASANDWWSKQAVGAADLPSHRPGSQTAYVSWSLLLGVIVLFAWHYPLSSFEAGGGQWQLPAIPILAGIYALGGWWLLRQSVYHVLLFHLSLAIGGIVVGVMAHGWYMEEIAAVFLAMAVVNAGVMQQSADDFVHEFLAGARDMASAALVVGLAAGILVILEQGLIIDAMLYHTANLFKDLPKAWAAEVMFAVQTGINILVPSGSGQAALTMPVMAPLADLLGISRQTAVLAFQFGDGFTNLITPTSGVLIGVLGMARIEYAQWFRFMLPLQLLLLLTGALLLLPPLFWSLPGF